MANDNYSLLGSLNKLYDQARSHNSIRINQEEYGVRDYLNTRLCFALLGPIIQMMNFIGWSRFHLLGICSIKSDRWHLLNRYQTREPKRQSKTTQIHLQRTCDFCICKTIIAMIPFHREGMLYVITRLYKTHFTPLLRHILHYNNDDMTVSSTYSSNTTPTYKSSQKTITLIDLIETESLLIRKKN